MSQDNKFNQYGYNHYLKAPARPRPNAKHFVGESSGVAFRIMSKLKTPLVAVVSLGVIITFFVGIVIATYPSGNDEPRNIPIIKADLRPIKSEPLQRGGMSIANRESTIMANAGSVNIDAEAKSVENLLLRFSDDASDMVSKEDALNKAVMGEIPMSMPSPPKVMQRIDLVEGALGDKISDEVEIEITSINPQNVLQKIGSSAEGISNETDDEFNQKTAAAALLVKPKFEKRAIYAAASSPDTLDFVRKILDEKSSGISSIEPAVGAASPASNVATSLYFVQLASITDPARAGSEWAKMQDKYNVLSQSKFRVQEASLPSGKFYRIQAGPMSKSEAEDICNSLKAQNKAGGCLVVK